MNKRYRLANGVTLTVSSRNELGECRVVLRGVLGGFKGVIGFTPEELPKIIALFREAVKQPEAEVQE